MRSPARRILEQSDQGSHKLPKKLVSLLKILVALGGKDVPEHVLAELLWPDEEGDVAANSMAANLHRLRKLLGDPDTVPLHAGLLSLNAERCWVDAWACEHLLDATRDTFKQGHRQQASSLADQALALYRGNFLHTDTDAPWSLSMRERLRGKFTDCVVLTGTELEQTEQFDQAIEYYKRGLEADNLGEPFYQGLMRCYLKLDRRAEGVATYRRLRELLSVTLNVSPSPQSQALYQALQAP